jgi:hypothetical protein
MKNRIDSGNPNNRRNQKYYSLLEAIEQPRLEDFHVTFRTPLHVPDKEYRTFLMRGISDTSHSEHRRKANGFRWTQSCCAGTCAGFSLTGVIFLTLIGILLDTQPIFIKGSLPKISLQTNEQSKLVEQYLLPIRGTPERLPMAKNAYQAAIVYMMTFTISLYFIHQDRINDKLNFVALSLSRVVLSNPTVQEVTRSTSNIRQRVRVFFYHFRFKRSYDSILLEDQCDNATLPIYHLSTENSNASGDSKCRVWLRHVTALALRISCCLPSWSVLAWKSASRGPYQQHHPQRLLRRTISGGGINGNVHQTNSGGGKDAILPLHSANSNASHLLGNSYQKAYTTIPANDTTANGIWNATRGTMQQIFNARSWYQENNSQPFSSVTLTKRHRPRRADNTYIHKKQEV